jgi:mannose-6-phosphate isomerase-like protein (cupin superfamily)
MILKWHGEGWEGVENNLYKKETSSWQDVTRHVLYAHPNSDFETRYFEIGPGGYSSHEQHVHEHCVIVLRGNGVVVLDGKELEIGPFDVVRVTAETPHQFRNNSTEPLGIICIVDRERDRPQLLGNLETVGALEKK